MARIYIEEKPSASASPGPGDTVNHVVDPESALHGADYVEARGTLVPSTEYFSRAVDIAQEQGELSGELLAMVRLHFKVYFACGSDYPLLIILAGCGGFHEPRQCLLL